MNTRIRSGKSKKDHGWNTRDETPWKRRDNNIAKMNRMRYQELKYYCYQYHDWKNEIKALNKDLGPNGVSYDGMPHVGGTSSAVERKALRLCLLQQKIDMVDEAARKASLELQRFILAYCTNPDMTFRHLEVVEHIPCSQATFYRIRASFFRELSDILDSQIV